MPNRKYEKGRRFEYKVKRLFEEMGYVVIRSASSHSFADLIALKKKDIIFIQCKDNNMSLNAKKKLLIQMENDSSLELFLTCSCMVVDKSLTVIDDFKIRCKHGYEKYNR